MRRLMIKCLVSASAFYIALIQGVYGFSSDPAKLCRAVNTQCYYAAPVPAPGGSGLAANKPVSIQSALALAEEFRQGHLDASIVIVMRGGRYELSDPLIITPRLAGSATGRTDFMSFPGEIPVISGGTIISQWKQQSKGMFETNVGRGFRQLYASDNWLQRAREPNIGDYEKIRRWYVDADADQKDKKNQAIVLDAALAAKVFPGVELHVQRVFNGHIYRVSAVKLVSEELQITLAEPESSVAYKRSYPRKLNNQAFHLEGAFEYVDQNGEWYLSPAGKLVLKWSSLESLNRTTVVAPRLESLIVLQGLPDRPVSHVGIHGLIFSDTTWSEPNFVGFVPKQGSFFNEVSTTTIVPGAIEIQYADDISIENNVFRNLGGAGIVAVEGLVNSAFRSNKLTNIAGCGFVLGASLHPAPNAWQKIDNVLVDRNIIKFIGRDYPGAVGILATYASRLTITNNVLQDLPYTAISVGWGWTLNRTSLRENKVISNDIRTVMSMLSDGGAIYFLSNQPGSEISLNKISDIHTAKWNVFQFMSAIYLDKGASGISVINNAIWDIGPLSERNRHFFNQKGNPPL
jgi:hypothetical protein